MAKADRAGPASSPAVWRVEAASVIDPERLLAYADAWRRLAEKWTQRAERCGEPPGAARLRRTAHAALHAAHEAEELFRARDRRGLLLASRRGPTDPRAPMRSAS